LALDNEAGGTIDATGANALVIDTGSNAVANSGTLEASGAGGLVIDSALQNSGTLWANGGNVTAEGAVSARGGGSPGSDNALISSQAKLVGSRCAPTTKM
jgi:large repetitive protein